MNAGADLVGSARRVAAGALRRLRDAGAAPASRSALEYTAWLDRRLEERAQLAAEPVPAGRFSILTCLYERSPAGLFRKTAASVLAREATAFEWIIVAQGALPGDLAAALDEVSADARVRCLMKPENVGIIRGLRAALEAATGDYVVPLDGDDLFFADTLAVLAGEIGRRGLPAFVYGDEDALVGGVPALPYFRPDWDPLLNMASSYIWHPCAFDRRRALDLGVYTDPGSEFCQDWDTVFRFSAAGIEPAHVPEVLYHWTAHDASSTHRAEPNSGSPDSQRHVLQGELRRRSLLATFDLQPFPLDRGLPELWPHRRHQGPPSATVLVMSDAPGAATTCLDSVARSCDYPLDATTIVGCEPLSEHCEGRIPDLRQAVAQIDSEWTAVFTPEAVPQGADWLWEAVGVGELVPQVGFIAGRLVDGRNVVRGGGELWGAGDPCGCPDRGHPAQDPGPYAISLEPHCVSAVDPRFFVARTTLLATALSDLPDDASFGFLGVWLGRWAERNGVRTACSPLVTARCPRRLDATPSADLRERRAVIERFGALPAADPLVSLYRLTGRRSFSG